MKETRGKHAENPRGTRGKQGMERLEKHTAIKLKVKDANG